MDEKSQFRVYLEKIGEIGFVQESYSSLVYVNGLPNVKPGEIVIFETEDVGITRSFSEEAVEVLLLTKSTLKVGTQVVRTDSQLTIGINEKILGRSIDPIGKPIDDKPDLTGNLSHLMIETTPKGVMERKEITKHLATGVSIVDLVIPLGRGQRELIIGDRKTGKTEFLLQTIQTQAIEKTVCIYAVIGQKQKDIQNLINFFSQGETTKDVIVVASSSISPAGLIYITPYTAMTIAEFFRDLGRDVLLILDDMTTHARVYRQISLLARRFPGRGAYPGDIFYLHSRLIERAGNFEEGSITCLPVAESVLGDLSGYIQTNLMSMTDGHIFFDIDLYNQGKRPAINPFLSVTRVGHQTQTPLEREISRELSSFLVSYERMKQFTHFGAEVGEATRKIIDLGDKVDLVLNQGTDVVLPVNFTLILFALLWAGVWREDKSRDIRQEIDMLLDAYLKSPDLKQKIDKLISMSQTLQVFVENIRKCFDEIFQDIRRFAEGKNSE